jgi:hypothetical protein
MPLIEHRTRVAIADEFNSAENDVTHGMVDLAAALASGTWDATPLGHAVGELYSAFEQAVPFEFSDLLGRVEGAGEEAMRFAARLGFALARTMSSADRGWNAWLADAESWLQTAGCGVTAHQDTPQAYREEFLAGLQKIQASGEWRVAPSASEVPKVVRSAMETISGVIGETVDEALAEHNRQHHAKPVETVSRVDVALTRMGAAVQESLDDHVRLHHADRPAPAVVPTSDPSAPKTQPTVEQPKRQPAASRAATAPPVRHRAVDAGHVAAAVPGFDQCAGDDLEMAGHRHPRATDPWFAEHGA